MPRLITKFKYLKPNRKLSAGGYAAYIATREGVEKIDESQRLLPTTERQTALIRRLIRDFPDSKKTFEYEDYLKRKTVGCASDFISRTIEDHAERCVNVKTYADYIATRPRAERFGSHGLFTDDGVPVRLSKVSEELNHYEGNVWTAIISLRREDAERLGYDHGARWRDMLRTQTQAFSEAFHIPLRNLKWFAAFHNESYHPHVHLIIYSDEPSEGFLSRAGVEQLRSSLAKDIFAQDLHSVYVAQTEQRDALRTQSKARITEIISQINCGVYDSPLVEELLLKLSRKLNDSSGKKVYGYLKPELKALVDSIVDELATEDRIKKLYDLWYKQREEVLRTYTDTIPKRIPLSENKEFKSIKNAVIQEALNLNLRHIPVAELEEAEASTQPEPMPDDSEDEENADSFNASFPLYTAALACLKRDTEEYDPEKAVTMLTVAAEDGFSLAQYWLGKMLLLGKETVQSVEDAVFWLEKAAAQNNEWAQYLLGKTLLRGELVLRDADRGAELLEASFQQGNPYAAYTLGKAYLDGQLMPQDVPAGLERLTLSAQKGFAPAQYLYGKLLYLGKLIPQDHDAALRYLNAAAECGDSNAAVLAAKILLTVENGKRVPDAIRLLELAAENGSDYAEYLLGRLYLSGQEVEQNVSLALRWLEAASDHGNQSAKQILHSYHAGRVWSCSLGALQLLQQLARAFENRQQEQNRNIRQMKAERKLLQKIEEKRQAHGLKHG